MANTSAVKTHREPLFHVVKRDDMPMGKAWLIRILTIVISFMFIGVVSMSADRKEAIRNFADSLLNRIR